MPIDGSMRRQGSCDSEEPQARRASAASRASRDDAPQEDPFLPLLFAAVVLFALVVSPVVYFKSFYTLAQVEQAAACLPPDMFIALDTKKDCSELDVPDDVFVLIRCKAHKEWLEDFAGPENAKAIDKTNAFVLQVSGWKDETGVSPWTPSRQCSGPHGMIHDKIGGSPQDISATPVYDHHFQLCKGKASECLLNYPLNPHECYYLFDDSKPPADFDESAYKPIVGDLQYILQWTETCKCWLAVYWCNSVRTLGLILLSVALGSWHAAWAAVKRGANAVTGGVVLEPSSRAELLNEVGGQEERTELPTAPPQLSEMQRARILLGKFLVIWRRKRPAAYRRGVRCIAWTCAAWAFLATGMKSIPFSALATLHWLGVTIAWLLAVGVFLKPVWHAYKTIDANALIQIICQEMKGLTMTRRTTSQGEAGSSYFDDYDKLSSPGSSPKSPELREVRNERMGNFAP
mmetsp:Transcript_69721/g.167370  ORF Transcript_69721/g.167370 Transcript_69721/m.167370 type:complete len:461 (+) Transcript_69721:100-1482(+)